ncbi:hypothetical protein PENDEC_c011G02400 [Penicillium decumbens]|uniref:Uncharacterized protein n=1 Tax=Penicillium decumbens TaxID=69771 RepID=A0A1V6PBW9_PENDC|nr:hypothetical protein PENDEC_c011G02400 [Penicillium decumbens]
MRQEHGTRKAIRSDPNHKMVNGPWRKFTINKPSRVLMMIHDDPMSRNVFPFGDDPLVPDE